MSSVADSFFGFEQEVKKRIAQVNLERIEVDNRMSSFFSNVEFTNLNEDQRSSFHDLRYLY